MCSGMGAAGLAGVTEMRRRHKGDRDMRHRERKKQTGRERNRQRERKKQTEEEKETEGEKETDRGRNRSIPLRGE